MADLTARIKPKKSSTTGEVPQAADLEVAELAVNTADGKLFVKHTDNSIKEISGGVDSVASKTGAVTLELIDNTDVGLTTVPPTLPANTVVAITGEGTNGDTTFTNIGNGVSGDGTAANDAQISNAQSKFYGTSIALDGIQDAVVIAHDNEQIIGNSDATVQFWVRFNVLTNATTYGFVDKSSANTSAVAWRFTYSHSTTGNSNFWYTRSANGFSLSSEQFVYSNNRLSVDTWHHIRVCQFGTQAFCFVDGVHVGNANTLAVFQPASTADLRIGALYTTNSNAINGYINDFQIINGTALSTSTASFTPPTTGLGSPTPVAPTDGQVLTYNGTASEWQPATPSGGGGALNDLSDVTVTAPSPVFKTDFEGIFPDLNNGSGGTVSTEQANSGTRSFKATGVYGSLNFGQVLKDGAARYDCWSFWVYPTQNLDTTYRLSLGGTLPTIGSGEGYGIYTRDTGFGLYSGNNFQELGTRPTILANQWHHVFVQIDFGTNDRFKTGPSNISIWIDGSLAANNVAWPQAITAYTNNGDGFVFRFAESASGSAHDKYIDDFRICQTDTPIASMTEATVVPATIDAAIDATPYGLATNIGLVYDGSGWVPGWPEYYPPATGSLPYSALEGTALDGNGSLEIDGLDQITFTSADAPVDQIWKIYANSIRGMSLGAYLASDIDAGSFIHLHKDKGVSLRSSTNLFLLTGTIDLTNNQPELRWETGDPKAGTPTGNYFGLKLPAGYSVNQTYILPSVDGNAGAALTTNGSGTLAFTDMISKATLKAEVAASTDFADFQARIAAL